MIYKYTNTEKVSVFIVEDDGSCKKSLLINGCDPANTDYQEYLKWVEAGNIPEPADE
jgi:hypothetical protein